ncbi:MAG: DUF2235 domain-containing protein [Rhodoplanes sp.]|uniref:DUF2235 domain-containing protein n=1 Tax=Rhodoplanes sp. TaxID=1968906 RepID=UPI001803551B|nr:DUF2235 domain-containing protein [Rhodoplanes sp.]NVO17429.1 DUF2235 domain-containing protein [Rhodoplanes sp.]
MAKNIVLLSDGTGNSASSVQKTNIWRLYRALDLTADDQIAIYDDGVGTGSFRPLAVAGQAFGLGLARNVRDLFTFLSRNYVPGDRVYAFGFSRGSFTIRMLVGMVRHKGLVDRSLPEDKFQKEVLRRWADYRKRFERRKLRYTLGRGKDERMEKRTTLTTSKADQEGLVPDFEFVGLWDTVDAYGLPIDELMYGIDLWIYPVSFADRRLTRHVKAAYHALSVDDERRTFHPVLWDEIAEGTDPDIPADRLKQVWFPGVHANVGGGYAKDGLALVSLEWMLTAPELKTLKLHQIHVDEIRRQVDIYDDLIDSRAGLAGYYRYAPRNISALCHDEFAEVEIARPKIHESVFRRVKGHHVAYAPPGIPAEYDVVLRDGTIVKWEDRASAPAAQQCFETDDAAKLRAERMEAAWNVIWWRRVVYFLTLGSSAFLAALPWLTSSIGVSAVLPRISGRLTALITPVLDIAATVLPGFVATKWFGAFKQEPILFLIGAAAVAGTMALGMNLKLRIECRAGQVWANRYEGGVVPAWASEAIKTWFFRFRTKPMLVAWYKAFAREILPTIAIFGTILLLLWAASTDWRIAVALAVVAVVIGMRNIVLRL